MRHDSMSIPIGAVAAALLSGPALAQAAPAATQNAAVSAQESAQSAAQAGGLSGGLEEIIVTARRREESLQRVPVAVTALTTEGLREANVSRIENLGNVAPSLIIAPTNGRTNVPGFAIRGQRQDAGFLTNDPSVGIYVAEAVQARVFGLAQSLFDLESVQVLKGPQGTLFGRNTTGGAILFQPQRPVLGDVGGYAQMRYGNFDRFDVQGAVSVPLGSVFAARLAYNRTRRDGFVTNRSNGQHLNEEHTDSFRGTLLFQPGDSFSNTLYVDYFEADAAGSAARLTAVNPTGLANSRFGLQAILDRQNANFDFYEVEGNVVGRSAGSNFGVTNVTVGELSDTLTLKNIASYRHIKSSEDQDLDGTNQPVLATFDDQQVQQLTNELQLQGKTADGRFDFIVGAFYFVEDGFRTTLTASLGAAPSPRRGEATNESYSVFAQGDYKITDTLTLTLGGRYNWDNRSFQQYLRSATTGACTFCSPKVGKSFKAPTYTAGLSWQIDPQKMLYVTHRRGYRAGGFNSSGNNAASLLPFEPETVTDYEVGFKADWNLGPSQLRTNIALYHTDYADIQRAIILPINNVPITSIFNAASAKIDGAEAEVQFLPVRGIELSGSTAYTNTVYKDFQYQDAAGALIDQSANRFAYIPKWTYRLAGRVYFPLDGKGTEFSASADYYWQSEVFFSEFNSPLAQQGAYALVGARAELRDIAGTGITAGLWGRNLTNKRYFHSGGEQYSGLGLIYKQFAEPRTYGVELSVRF